MCTLKKLMTMRGCLIGLAVAMTLSSTARAQEDLTVAIELGPIEGAANDNRSVSFDPASRTKRTVFDPLDGREHRMRGVSLTDLLANIRRPAAADTVVFNFSNGMQVSVHLKEVGEIAQLFIAFEEGDALGAYTRIDGPRVLHTKRPRGFSIWQYANQLTSVRLVTWKSYEALLAQPTRQLPSQPGWKLYLRHCQSCHGMRSEGARRGPDFLSDLDAYRRVPPLAVTEVGESPSLHEKVSGAIQGEMPTLSHVPRRDIVELWRWLHSVHRGATK